MPLTGVPVCTVVVGAARTARIEVHQRHTPNIMRARAMKAAGIPWQPSPWVCPRSASESGYVEEPRYAHGATTEEAGLPYVTLQGLRRSFGTLAEWLEVPTGIVVRIQRYKPSALAEKHRRRCLLDPLHSWHVKIEAWMLEHASIDYNPEQHQWGLQAVE